MEWQVIGAFLIYTLAALLCLGGLILSGISLSGTWLVLLAAGLLSWLRWPEFPSIGTLIIFLLLCAAVEVLEAVAGAWGIQKRGGSKAAGWAAIVGGLIGTVAGGMFIPVLGNLLGMLLGSFGLAFWVEHARMKKTEHAAHVAFGAVIARIGIICIKLGITFILIIILIIGITLG